MRRRQPVLHHVDVNQFGAWMFSAGAAAGFVVGLLVAHFA